MTGGKRKGAGRKTISKEGKLVRMFIGVTPSQKAWIDSNVDNVSHFFRDILKGVTK